MRRNFVWMLLLLGLAAGVCAPAVQAAQPGLRAELAVEKASYARGEEIALRFTLHNDSATDLFVLQWRTPLAGFYGDVLDVTRDGEPVAYSGRLYKLGQPTAAQFIRVPAGEAVSAVFDPSAAYEMDVTGNYAIRFRTELLDARGVKAEKRGDAIGVESGAAELFLQGLTSEEAAALAADREQQAIEKSITPSYVSCSTSRQSTLVSALNMAQTMATESYNHLVSYPSGDSRYTTWFGTFSSTRYNSVKSHFSNEKNAFTSSRFTFWCDCNDPGTYAYVYANQPYNVHLCPVFWTSPLKGTDSQGGTLVHETSHFTVVAGTSDYAYGQTACKRLASSNPKKAVNNADSHEYYAEQGTK